MGEVITASFLADFRPNLEIREVTVEELNGGVVRLSEMTADQRDRYERSMSKMDSDGVIRPTRPENIRERLIALCMVDGAGHLVFSTPEDGIEALGRLPARVIETLFDECQKLLGNRDEEGEGEGNVSEGD